jgi:twitching motility protein PilI
MNWLQPTEALNRLQLDPSEMAVSVHEELYGRASYGFRVAGLGLVIASGQSSEILERPVIYPIPNTAPWLRGLINLRGNVVPVFDLAGLLELPREPQPSADKTLLLVVGKGDDALGLVIDAYPAPVDLSSPLTETPPLPQGLQVFHRGTYFYDGDVWLEIDIPGFVVSLAAGMSA